MSKLHVKKGDTVKVISGADKGKIGEIVAVNKDSGRVMVEGVSIITKHVKPKSAQQKGGRIEQTGTINSSNLMIICGECNTPTRVAKKEMEVDGKIKKVRVCKNCGANLDISTKKATARKAKKKAKAPKAEAETN